MARILQALRRVADTGGGDRRVPARPQSQSRRTHGRCREGKQEFPDGTVITRLAWAYTPSEENNKILGQQQSFVAGAPKEGVQFMVKDSTKYAATGGWGFAQFNDGKAVDEAVIKTCFPCHEPAKGHDFVFTRCAP
jgi:hypothetical protein